MLLSACGGGSQLTSTEDIAGGVGLGSVDQGIDAYNESMSDASTQSSSADIEGETREARIKRLDKAFMDSFKSKSEEEKREIVKSIREIVKRLRDLSPEEREGALKELDPPLPSRKVLNKIMKKKPKAQEQAAV